MVMPRSRSSGALSIWSKATNFAHPLVASTLVIAAVSVVLPWSTCPIVPMLTCGLVRENFSLPMSSSPLTNRPDGPLTRRFRDDLFADALRRLLVARELHRVGGAALAERAQGGGVAEHLPQRHPAGDD